MQSAKLFECINKNFQQLITSLALFIFVCFSLNSQEYLDTRYVQLLVAKKYDSARLLRDSVCNEKTELNIFFCEIFDGFDQVYPNYNTDEAIKIFFNVLKFAEDKKLDKKYHIHAHLSIAETFYMLEDFEKSLQFYKNAEEISIEKGNYMLPLINYGYLATYIALSDTTNMINYQQKIIKQLDPNNPTDRKRILLLNFDYHFIKENTDSIIYYGVLILDTSKNEYLNAMVSLKVAHSFMCKQDTIQAIQAFETSFKYAMGISHAESIQLTSDNLKAIYLNFGDLEKARYYSQISDSLKDYVYDQNKYNEAIEAKEDYQWNKKIKSYKSKTKLLLAVLGILIVFILLSLILYFNRIKKKKKALLASKILKEKQDLTIEEKLNQSISTNIFLDKRIDLSSMAEKLEIKNKRSLSEFIKAKYDKTFPSFINDLRFEYLKTTLVKKPDFDQLKIDDISSQLGFGSTRSFQIYIKKKTGLSPSDFLITLSESKK